MPPVKYSPGSFSKNFAWHGTGLRKLHGAIRNGFHDTLSPIDRQTFRSDAGVEGDIVLIPINFFLHNLKGQVSVDELVFQAIERDHSTQFDRLALFALNLNRVGSGRDIHSGREIVSRPAMWANEFVRQRLWASGTWQTSALAVASLDPFLEGRLDAQNGVRVKCRTNYRHMFELCNYLPTAQSMINSGADEWVASALFLVWDRHLLDGGAQEKQVLLGLIESDEIYKLLGIPRAYALAQAHPLLELYDVAGRLDRFQKSTYFSSLGALQPAEQTTGVRDEPGLIEWSNQEEVGLHWLDQEGSDAMVERRSVERKEQKRDRKKAVTLKRRYKNSCQFCGTRLQVGDGRFYSEAAHIKGLGEPHNGPDKTANMLVLCPNHHLQFDRGVLRLRKEGTHYKILSKSADDPLNGKRIKLEHPIEDEYVKHHRHWFD